MQKTVNILGKEEPIDLYNATVIHANKYYRTSGGWGGWPVTSTLYTDVVFRDKLSGNDWPISITNLDLPLYTEQEIAVICIKNIIVGYIDRKANRYYYTTSNLGKAFQAGMPYWAVWAIGVPVGILLGMLAGTELAYLGFLPLLIAMAVYYVQNGMVNHRITRAIDHYMTGE